jgi:hypothetical protein
MNILPNLWSDTAGRIFLITFASYLFGYMIYGGYIYTYFGRIWLQTSTDRFYPDFVCLLNDDQFLVMVYKGEDRWTNDDSTEKRIIGQVWEKRSKGKCLFIMPKGTDQNSILQKIKTPN